MKVGDYVRIRWGNGLQTISKCKNIVDMGDTQYAKDDFYIHTDHSGEVIYKTMIVKSSPNIIDLIEVGDYVNGERVIALEKDVDKRNIYPSNVGAKIFTDYELQGNWYFGIQEEDIKSIVTKEQFLQMEYKVN